ncbi:uncharacterized protein LOC113676154 [Pocillopora damicornis]|uniref:uncharacterized protein LOC113676154 n=1 Tax=Pocillopora damicornis TaxID=46731 RepID=UPI000F55344D|nr:uncharacterized protein LOC113676154 [Pocillopora damicornis]
MLRLGSPKCKEKSVKTVSETGPSCCADRILNCVQEVDDYRCRENMSEGQTISSKTPSKYINHGRKAEIGGGERVHDTCKSGISTPFTKEAKEKLRP